MDYVDRLTQLREDRDLHQQDIAEILNCQQSAISKSEQRKSKYKVEDTIKLCAFYKVSADYILGLPDLLYPKR